MGKVYDKILKQLERNPRGFQGDLAKLAGYASGGSFVRVLKEDRDIAKLDGFIKVIEMLFPNNSHDLLVEYAHELDPKKMTIKLLLEFATLYYKYDLVKVIIEIIKSSGKKESVDFADVYEINRQVQMKELSTLEGIRKLVSHCNSKPEVKTFAKIALIYCHYEMRNIQMINLYLDELEEDVKEIKNDFLRNSYTGRTFRTKVSINLHNDNIGKLIEGMFLIENAPDPTKTMIYLQVGNSFMTKSYDKAMYYFNKAMECKDSKSEFEIKQSINFTSLLWDRLDNFRCDGTKSNDLFYYIKSGNKGMAEKTLNVINFDELTIHGKAFNCFYKGLLYNEKSYFYKSIEYFKQANDKFYRQLPIMELKKMGVSDYVLSALSA